MLGGRVAAKAIDAARRVAQLVPFHVRAADTAAHIGCDAAIGAEIDIGVGHQRVGSQGAKIRRDATTGNRATEAARGASEIRFAHIVKGHVTAEIVVELITDTAADDIAVLDCRCIKIL
ncbi:hypothetical protein D3C86_1783820 [compost metagenome]